MTTLMNSDAASAIRTFCAAFARRRFMTAPEFSAPASWHAFRDQYEQDYGSQIHPIRTQWFADMVRRATNADLDALEALRTEEGTSDFQTCMVRCIQQNLLEKAYEERPDSTAAIPFWFHAQGWDIPPEWVAAAQAPPAVNPSLAATEADYAAGT
jgi:hypothetical protein